MNPFNLTGWEAVLATVAVCATVVYCWRLTCVTTTLVTSTICSAIDRMWLALKDIAVTIIANKSETK